ncbi:peroxiredoxin [Pseudogulbenkiania ferrooxidans]|uniref:thioredoxin-dependent peroxiredoxin n=1 Tax=Pseudogulbenkiania ferrooxidans 2002 TaxID=279714 RepID=B9Z270_9NEIS|nr:peroxiredoxin [Pseudogulbenkiania ferrooxidans]EEG09515.1 alkyl hydroperoxide reductase/ Thiol specific antioxidant/ Mal allergen [Pseudogulbenkiania ferrooxidans 2002]
MSKSDPNPYSLPPDLPVPQDDGACAHLPDRVVPDIMLTATEGEQWNLAHIAQARAVVYVYPATGVPGKDPIPDWDAIPGAPGCTLQSLGFRDHYPEFQELGYPVFGISGQRSEEQAEFKHRTLLPLVLLSDPQFQLRDRLGLPTFQAHGKEFYKRLVLVLRAGKIHRVFYPVFPPDQCAAMVLARLKETS